MGKFLCHCFLYLPDAILREVSIVAWARPRTPIICACFVVACFRFMPSISSISFITLEMKTLYLSVKMSVRKWACLVMMSILTF